MKTKREIILETIDYYSEDINRRGVENGRCSYFTNDEKMCAVGRCLKDPKQFKRYSGAVFALFREFNPNDILKDEYHGHDVNFWLALQRFHDAWPWSEHPKPSLEDLLTFTCYPSHQLDA